MTDPFALTPLIPALLTVRLAVYFWRGFLAWFGMGVTTGTANDPSSPSPPRRANPPKAGKPMTDRDCEPGRDGSDGRSMVKDCREVMAKCVLCEESSGDAPDSLLVDRRNEGKKKTSKQAKSDILQPFVKASIKGAVL